MMTTTVSSYRFYVSSACIRITATRFRNYVSFCNLHLADVPAEGSVPEPQVERKRPHSDDADGRHSHNPDCNLLRSQNFYMCIK